MLAIKKLAVLVLAAIALTCSPVALASQVDAVPRRLRSEPVRLLATHTMAAVSTGDEDDAVGADFAEDAVEIRASTDEEEENDGGIAESTGAEVRSIPDDSPEAESRGQITEMLVNKAVDKASEKAKKMKDRAKEKVKGKTTQIKEKAKEKAKAKAKEVKDRVKDRVKQKIKDKINGVPSAGGSTQPSADTSNGETTDADTETESDSGATERRQ
jgi:hypothetical protein